MNRHKIACIEVFEGCNLRCPLCPIGSTGTRSLKKMSFLQFKQLVLMVMEMGIDQIVLFNWGEGLLNPYIVKMIKLCKNKELVTHIHSNLNHNFTLLYDAIEAGLNYLSISIDGLSQKSYSQYHKGGNFNLAFQNLKKVASLQEEFSFKATWRFIVNRFNEDELAHARNIANSIGVEFYPLPIGLGDDLPDSNIFQFSDDLKMEWIARNNKFAVRKEYGGEFKFEQNGCFYLENFIVIKSNLNISPCCMTVKDASDFGSLKINSLKEIIHNKKFQTARELFRGKQVRSESNTKNETEVVCNNCTIYYNYLKSIKNPKRNNSNQQNVTKNISTIIKNKMLSDYLISIDDASFFARLNIAIEATNLSQKYISTKNDLNNCRDLLQYADSVLFNIPDFSMLRLSPYALIILGSNSLYDKTLNNDIEFMAYSFESSKDFKDIFLPALLGILIGLNGKVDPWCATNILGGYATLTPLSNEIEAHLDYPILRIFARKDENKYKYSVLGGGVFLDLLGKRVTGNNFVVKKCRQNKIELFERNYHYLKEVAVNIAKYNLQKENQPKKYLENCLFNLYFIYNLFNDDLRKNIISAEKPQLLFELIGKDLNISIQDIDQIRRGIIHFINIA